MLLSSSFSLPYPLSETKDARRCSGQPHTLDIDSPGNTLPHRPRINKVNAHTHLKYLRFHRTRCTPSPRTFPRASMGTAQSHHKVTLRKFKTSTKVLFSIHSMPDFLIVSVMSFIAVVLISHGTWHVVVSSHHVPSLSFSPTRVASCATDTCGDCRGVDVKSALQC